MQLLRWLFTNRQTGRLTIAQWPNAPLWVWLAATALQALTPLSGTPDRVVGLAGAAGLALWGAWEVGSGVNPWRRLLGLGALLAVARSVTA